MIRVYAHRGASKQLPENTLEAFAKALELGADALETDVHLSQDGHVIVSHDPTALRMAGVPRAIYESTLDEVKTWDVGAKFNGPRASRSFSMPTLDEVLSEFPDTIINIDLKSEAPALVDAALSVIRAHTAEKRVQLASFHWKQLMRVRARRYRGIVSMAPLETVGCLFAPHRLMRALPLHRSIVQLPTASDYADTASARTRARLARLYKVRRELAPEAPMPREPFVDERGMVELFHSLGVEVDFWTVNTPSDALRLVEAGADGIMTDDPATIVPVVRG